MTAVYENNNQQISADKGIGPLELEDAVACRCLPLPAAVAAGEERQQPLACRRGVWF